eukprot:CAMPEP_0175882964 /NCGR_PEP_ID=MMETSP0107_2-20121207/43708_2 /TAXON_ID=195067 ORGANISM="Goniomonas pacifica, Strain CCMP1869" /NCGR_SAMPLE_ID=MMETSP0107_2 /ASSEMBLY_ACC=CAM_ASM_000203 /LENGTH=41 /DNA_ID= /DNA_START= /DNA_END= /DNA_ORIENTATION=
MSRGFWAAMASTIRFAASSCFKMGRRSGKREDTPSNNPVSM